MLFLDKIKSFFNAKKEENTDIKTVSFDSDKNIVNHPSVKTEEILPEENKKPTKNISLPTKSNKEKPDIKTVSFDSDGNGTNHSRSNSNDGTPAEIKKLAKNLYSKIEKLGKK